MQMAQLSRSISQSKFLNLPFFARRKNSEDSENTGSMRIIDVLSNHYDEDDGGISEKKGVLDSRLLISRFFSKNSFRILKKRWKRKAVSGLELDSDSDRPASSNAIHEVAVSDSGRKHEDIAFNLGMGVGLIFLLTKSASEFNKMTELRTQMEMLLEEIRQEVHRRDLKDSSSESNDNNSVSCSHCSVNTNTSKAASMPNCNDYSDRAVAKSNREVKNAAAFASAGSQSMGQMEAELEVELERLQHNLEGEGSSLLQHGIKADCDSSDPSFESFSIDYEEDNAPVNENQDFTGVSAHDLERKLHELLETRQREQIEELEAALELAEKKLREKEMEIDWWKETQWAALFGKEESFISREL